MPRRSTKLEGEEVFQESRSLLFKSRAERVACNEIPKNCSCIIYFISFIVHQVFADDIQ